MGMAKVVSCGRASLLSFPTYKVMTTMGEKLRSPPLVDFSLSCLCVLKMAGRVR